MRVIETHESQSGPVLLFFRRTMQFENWLADVTATEPDSQFIAADGVEHTVWSLRDPAAIEKMIEDFKHVGALYIADGHHRSAAASRVRASRAHGAARSLPNREDGFLSVIFPHDELQILPYNRVVRDLNGYTAQQFLDALAANYELQRTTQPGAGAGGRVRHVSGRPLASCASQIDAGTTVREGAESGERLGRVRVD